jgi:CheY-like chemotaxis protein
MPGLDGPETIRQIQKELGEQGPVSILMLTGPPTQEHTSLADELGVKRILSKPVTLSSLSNALSGLFQKTPAPKQRQAKPSDSSELVAHLKGASILLVEDNEVNQLVASRILKKAGLSVSIANNGLEALEMIQAAPYDLVLMDIQMPEMDGLEATRSIRRMEAFRSLPIVAMTAHAMSGDRELSLQSGMNDHVNKPIDVNELFKAIARWLPPDSGKVGAA